MGRKKKHKIEDWHWHEAMDRISLVARQWEREVEKAAAIAQNKDFKIRAADITNMMWALHHLVGDETEKDKP